MYSTMLINDIIIIILKESFEMEISQTVIASMIK